MVVTVHLLSLTFRGSSIMSDQAGSPNVAEQLFPALVQLLGPLLRLLLQLPLLRLPLLAVPDEVLYPLLAGVAAPLLELIVRPGTDKERL